MSEQGNGLGDNTTCMTGVSQENAATSNEKHGKKKSSSDQSKGARPKSGKKGSQKGSVENVEGNLEKPGHVGQERPKSGRPKSAKKNRDRKDSDAEPCDSGRSGQHMQPVKSVKDADRQSQGRHGDRRQEGNNGNRHHRKQNDPQGDRSCGQNKSRKTDRNRKPMFEPYLSGEELSKGLKSGILVQGPIRVNPKNFEEAYIPHPDGMSDIMINSLRDRNRALNGDIVAVLMYDRNQWQVNKDQLEDLMEKIQSEDKPQATECEDAAVKNASEDIVVNSVCEDTKASHDSDSDVVIESEEIVEYDGCNKVVNTVTVDSATASSGQSVSEITDKTSCISISSSDKTTKSQKTKDAGATPNSRSPQKRFTSVEKILKDGSPAVKNLFDSKTPGHGREKNMMNRVVQRTGKVVAVLEPKHSRSSTGHIKLMSDKNPNFALFSPMDSRLPRIMIPMTECPKDFFERPDDHSKTLFIARIKDWRENSLFADGNLMRSLGEAGQIEPETEGILIENDVDYSEFTEEALESLPIKTLPWSIPPQETEKRRDFRNQCVFTIDPATARDLDDALSIEKCDDGTYNVGVHIADVSYFLQEGTVLDKVASRRATSVYLVQKVIPMLPRILCEQLCSLNPDEDRLTFSVVWNMSENGEVYDEWFGRSIIRSCCKLSYDHAQGFIEQPGRSWTSEELPPISTKFSPQQIKERVLNLNKIAVNLRKLRFDNGALRLDQVKISFTLDSETKMPNGYRIYEQKDSNRLVEEFMLLANMAVAHKINDSFPKTALLRRHPSPQSKMIEDLAGLCSSLGVQLDISSAGALQRTIWRYCGDDEFSTARMQVLTALCSKPMQNAKYFCTGCIDDESEYRHYALNVPLYTHFTSPIRRYADVVVHRALSGALGYTDYKQNLLAVQRQSEHCNDKKTNSKIAQELSNNLYFAVFIKEAGPFEELGMVMAVLDKAFDVFILKLGVTKRVYCDKLAIKDKLFTKEQKQPILTLTWEATEWNPKEVVQKIAIFSLVKCVLKAGDLPLMWMATIIPPTE